MKAFKPLVAVGADHPLEEELLKADYFRKLTRQLRYFLLTACQMVEMAWEVFIPVLVFVSKVLLDV